MKAKESDTSRGGEDGANDCSDTWRRGRGARARALRRCCLLLSAACLVFLFQGFASLQRCGRCPGNEISICEAIVISLGFGTVNADNGPAFESRGFEFESTERGKSGFLSGPSESGGKRQSKGSGKRSEVAVRRNEGSGTEEVSGTDRISGTKPVSGTEPISEMARVRDPALRVSDGKGLARNQSGTEERNNQTAESVGSGLENRSDTQENGMEGVSVAVTAGTAAEAETETKRQSLTANSQQFSGTSDPAGLRDPGIERTTKSVVLRETARVSTQNSSQGQDASLKRQGLSDGRGQNNESAKVGDLDEASGLRGQTRPRSTLHRTNSSLPRVSNFTVPSNASRRWLNLASGKNWAEESSSAKSRPRLAKLNLTAVLKRSESGDSKPAIPSPQNAGAENAWSRRSSGNSVSRRVEKPPSQVPLAAGVNRLSERFREAGVSGNRQKPRPFRGDVNGLLGKRLVAGVNGLSRETSEPWVLRPSKIAFMFLANGRIHTDRIWDRFFRGAPSKDHYSIYIHSNLGPGFEYNERTTNASCFYGRTLPNSAPSLRFHISMVDAQTKLLRSALQDASNQWFVLLSDSCVPLHSFAFTYNYLFAGERSLPFLTGGAR
ncbi:hypothetical protein KFL_001630040 [Klebsormidium nitens]|uniref:Core-2/I-branching beta-1,6-N-acetylglucosaminyltransferase family protein n=1 Tax=Klebsormidium nitens TaxID=105231 RepID=A0A1Y1I526_KLENI|nr:hypothetical protein KFL_001630040 [Klebsormidium nitens]|eukprot:GAQ83806.1 hypothetical protein KFL_001630040 [Klebsormidium nitens]